MYILKLTARRCVPCVSKVFETKLPSLRGEIDCMGVYWWRSAQDVHSETDGAALCAVCFKSLHDRAPVASRRNGLYGRIFGMLKRHNLKQTARRCVPCVSKLFVTKLPSLLGEMGCMDVYWWRSAQHAHFETDRAALCAVCFKSLLDEAPRRFVENLTIWMYIGDAALKWTFWVRWHSAACCVFQMSSWRSSRRFVEKWSLWVYIGDAAPRCAFWNRRRDTACCMFQNSSWRSSRRFVEKWSLWVYIGDAALRCAFWNTRRNTACCMFQNSSWRSSRRFVEKWSIWVYIGDTALSCTFWNRRRDTACCMFHNSSWRSYQRFVDEVPHISRSDGIIKVLKRLAIWWILGVAVCFKTAST